MTKTYKIARLCSCLGFALLLCLAAGPAAGEAPKAEEAAPNVLLIVIDTLRADHLGCYGYGRDTSPNIDRFAKRGILFENVYCQMPTTGPSHASIFTSQYPQSHGILKNGWVLPDDYPTLAEILKSGGYTTAAIVSSFAVSSKLGYSRGFDHYDDKFLSSANSSSAAATWEWEGHLIEEGFDQIGDITTGKAVQWLGKNSSTPFFLWVHYFDPHSPYMPPDASYMKGFLDDAGTPLERTVAQYDGEIRFVDEQIGELLKAVTEKGLDSNTLIIIMSDHGEGLMQHGWMEHGKFLYDEQTRIALMMSLPGVIPMGSRTNAVVQSIDLMPTILEVLGLKSTAKLAGTSLMNIIQNPDSAADHTVFLQRKATDSPSTPGEEISEGNQFAVRYENLKYIWDPRQNAEELYDMTEDPQEKSNIIRAHPDKAARMSEMINRWKKDSEARGEIREQTIDQETRKKLKALGYMN